MTARRTASRDPGAPSASEQDARYSLGAVVRLTGLSAHTIRAWERRYEAVKPARTPGGTRRYTRAEIARLRLLRAAVEAGHRIGALAGLSDAEIEIHLSPLEPPTPPPLEQVRAAVERIDASEAERLLVMHYSVLGPVAFARRIAAPLLRDVGERWESGTLSVAAEHLVSAVVRGLLGDALRAAPSGSGPAVVFTTPAGERHEFGALIAAVAAMGAGARVTYLGPDLPVEEVARAAASAGARVVALSVVTRDGDPLRRYLDALRPRLPEAVQIWVGGRARPDTPPPASGIEWLDDLDELTSRVARMTREPGARAS